jgi:pimeloyl-ACP methyl ester carboxylesterase
MGSMPCLIATTGDAPSLPPGRPVDLPGRGTTFIHETRRRPGAPTLMLLHGLGATASLNWYTCFRELAKHAHVVAIDHRGHGQGVRAGTPFTLEDAADDAIALADALGIGHVIPVGYSMGGPIAQLMWRRHRDRVAGLVMCATSHRFRVTPAERVMFASLPALEQAVRAVPDAVCRRVWSAVTAGVAPVHGFAAWAAREMLLQDRRAIVQAAAALGRYNAEAWIRDIDVPTTVLVHQRDQLVPPARQLQLAGMIEGSMTRFVDVDHFGIVRNPELVLDALVEGVDDVVRAVRRAQTHDVVRACRERAARRSRGAAAPGRRCASTVPEADALPHVVQLTDWRRDRHHAAMSDGALDDRRAANRFDPVA